jgi:hypothetical protein
MERLKLAGMHAGDTFLRTATKEVSQVRLIILAPNVLQVTAHEIRHLACNPGLPRIHRIHLRFPWRIQVNPISEPVREISEPLSVAKIHSALYGSSGRGCCGVGNTRDRSRRESADQSGEASKECGRRAQARMPVPSPGFCGTIEIPGAKDALRMTTLAIWSPTSDLSRSPRVAGVFLSPRRRKLHTQRVERLRENHWPSPQQTTLLRH